MGSKAFLVQRKQCTSWSTVPHALSKLLGSESGGQGPCELDMPTPNIYDGNNRLCLNLTLGFCKTNITIVVIVQYWEIC